MRTTWRPDFSLERELLARYGAPVAGVDEVGRGPLAGPVLACAVILDPRRPSRELEARLDDSKRLSLATRTALAALVPHHGWIGVGAASSREIDRLNILQATLLAMRRAVLALPRPPAAVLVDGRSAPLLGMPVQTVIGGDGRALSIAAASVVAKTIRDRLMQRLAQRWPGYGWERNAGYGVAAHRAALLQHGPTPHHRRSFAPVRAALAESAGNEGARHRSPHRRGPSTGSDPCRDSS